MNWIIENWHWLVLVVLVVGLIVYLWRRTNAHEEAGREATKEYFDTTEYYDPVPVEPDNLDNASFTTQEARNQLDEDPAADYQAIKSRLQENGSIKNDPVPTTSETPIADEVVEEKKTAKFSKKIASKVPHAKFTAAEIREIRTSRGSAKEVAKRYNVSASAISAIRRRESYRDVR